MLPARHRTGVKPALDMRALKAQARGREKAARLRAAVARLQLKVMKLEHRLTRLRQKIVDSEDKATRLEQGFVPSEPDDRYAPTRPPTTPRP